MNKFDFLFSVRFWQLFLAGVSAGLIVYQQSHDWVLALSTAVGSWMTGSVAVGTFDKQGDKKIIAAGVQSGNVATESVVKIPPQE